MDKNHCVGLRHWLRGFRFRNVAHRPIPRISDSRRITAPSTKTQGASQSNITLEGRYHPLGALYLASSAFISSNS